MSTSDRTRRSEHKTETVQGKPPPPDDRSPPELDEAVLKAARRAVRFHWITRLLEKAHLSPVAGWQLLAGMTLGALICAGLDLLLGDDADPLPPGTIHAGDPPSSGTSEDDVDTRSPAYWLRHIAALVRDGRVTEAEAELRAFRQSYPDFADTPRHQALPRVP
jgi:hypothetical protein